MQVIGIVAEYNPFHHGHRYQIAAVRQRYPAAHVVAVMSGSFTQRGAPALLDKWTRAAHAVTGGVDLVLELPFVFACRSAQDFARGGISLLSRLGIVTHLAFGTEAEDITLLASFAERIDTVPVQMRLREYLGEGRSYADALTRALKHDEKQAEVLLRSPNNILAIEYLRALRVRAPQISPIAIQRVAARHEETCLQIGITSASSIRKALDAKHPPWEDLRQNVMPMVWNDLQTAHQNSIPREDTLLTLLRYLLLVTDISALASYNGIHEGIENRLIRCAKTAKAYRSFLADVSTKRYPQSQIARLIVHLLLHLKKNQTQDFDTGGVAYIRPLAFNQHGRSLLRSFKEKSHLPIVTRTAEALSKIHQASAECTHIRQMLSFDVRATDLRNLCLPTAPQISCRTDFIMSPKFLSD